MCLFAANLYAVTVKNPATYLKLCRNSPAKPYFSVLSRDGLGEKFGETAYIYEKSKRIVKYILFSSKIRFISVKFVEHLENKQFA
jgi:hypothetical protein